MRKAARFALTMIVVHTAVAAIHGAAHAAIPILLSRDQRVFVAVFSLILPLASGALLFTNLRRAGGAILAGSMAAIFLFGLYYHFFVAGPDNFSYAHTGAWGTLFRWTAVLLALTEALAFWAGLRVWMARSGAPAAEE
jgi:membrane-bound ClpP family serine protease